MQSLPPTPAVPATPTASTTTTGTAAVTALTLKAARATQIAANTIQRREEREAQRAARDAADAEETRVAAESASQAAAVKAAQRVRAKQQSDAAKAAHAANQAAERDAAEAVAAAARAAAPAAPAVAPAVAAAAVVATALVADGAAPADAWSEIFPPRAPRSTKQRRVAADVANVLAGVARAEDAPRAAPTNFFEAYMPMQHALRYGMFVEVTESYCEMVANIWSETRTRTIIVGLGGTSSRVRFPKACAEARAEALAMNRRRGCATTPHAGNVLQFSDSQACLSATIDTVFHYGVFPLAPGQVSSTGAFRLVGYGADAAVLSPERVIDVTSKWPASLVCAPSVQTSYWTTSSETGTDAVDRILADLGSPISTVRRMPDGALKQAFGMLAATAISGFAALPVGSPGKDAKLRRLLALVRMFARALVGKFTTRVRDAFARLQLSGLVCTQTVAPEVVRDATAAATGIDADEAAVRTAYRLASDSQLGRASSALVRMPQGAVDKAQQLLDLQALHPYGEPAADVELPANDVYSAASFTSAAVYQFVRSNLSGSSPGPDGWTYELLCDCLENPLFAHDFHAVIVDICNGHVEDDTRRVLAASGLIGLAKGPSPADGTRPIALGSVFLKVAASRALDAASPMLKTRFRGSQFGCATKGGAEKIVHTVRRFIREAKGVDGRVVGIRRIVVTLDFANAFNKPTRQAMWDATKDIPELVGIFNVSYGAHSELFVVGSDATITSASGARQGTVDGPVTFALVLQAVLNAADLLPNVDVMAYLDDITLMCETLADAEAAVELIQRLAGALGMELKPKKCEILSVAVLPDDAIAPTSPLAEFRVVDTLKLLGASVAVADLLESSHLEARMGTVVDVFCRRCKLSASPQIFEVMRLCGVPKLHYHLRTHNPAVTRTTARLFDVQITGVISHWSSISRFSSRQQVLMQAPRGRGGFGITRAEFIAPAAYQASLEAALGLGRHIRSQAALTQIFTDHFLAAATAEDAALLHQLAVLCLPGCDAALSCVNVSVHPDVFGAELRLRLAGDADSAGASLRLRCPGCRTNHDGFMRGGPWGQHVSSCCAQRGGLVTQRHNAVVAAVRSILFEAGFSPETAEPRDLGTYTCCKLEMNHDAYLEHRRVCQNAGKARRSGPDLRWQQNGRTVVGDVTIINLLCGTHAATDPAEAIAAAEQMKHTKYDLVCAQSGAVLLPLAATSNGHLAGALKDLITSASIAAFRNPLVVLQKISALIAYGGARTRLAAEDAIGIRPVLTSVHSAAAMRMFAVAPLPADELPVDGLGPILATPLPSVSLARRAAEDLLDPATIAFRRLTTDPNFIAAVLAECRKKVAREDAAVESPTAAAAAAVAAMAAKAAADAEAAVARERRAAARFNDNTRAAAVLSDTKARIQAEARAVSAAAEEARARDAEDDIADARATADLAALEAATWDEIGQASETVVKMTLFSQEEVDIATASSVAACRELAAATAKCDARTAAAQARIASAADMVAFAENEVAESHVIHAESVRAASSARAAASASMARATESLASARSRSCEAAATAASQWREGSAHVARLSRESFPLYDDGPQPAREYSVTSSQPPVAREHAVVVHRRASSCSVAPSHGYSPVPSHGPTSSYTRTPSSPPPAQPRGPSVAPGRSAEPSVAPSRSTEPSVAPSRVERSAAPSRTEPSVAPSRIEQSRSAVSPAPSAPAQQQPRSRIVTISAPSPHKQSSSSSSGFAASYPNLRADLSPSSASSSTNRASEQRQMPPSSSRSSAGSAVGSFFGSIRNLFGSSTPSSAAPSSSPSPARRPSGSVTSSPAARTPGPQQPSSSAWSPPPAARARASSPQRGNDRSSRQANRQYAAATGGTSPLWRTK